MRALIVAGNHTFNLFVRFEDGTMLSSSVTSCDDWDAASIDWFNGSASDGWTASGYRWSQSTLEAMPYPTANNVTYMYCAGNSIRNGLEDPTYISMAAFTAYSRRCIWLPATYMPMPGREDYSLNMLCGMTTPAGTFMGVVSGGFLASNLGTFLRSIVATANTYMFLIDDSGYLLASSEVGATVFTMTESYAGAPEPSGCSLSTLAFPQQTPVTLGCRPSWQTYTYAPLTAVPKSLALTKSALEYSLLKHSGTRYYVVSLRMATSITNGVNFNLICIMPETDVLGGVVTARNIAIAVTCVALAIAVLSAAAFVSSILAPLSLVKERMVKTSELRDDGGGDDFNEDEFEQDLNAAGGAMGSQAFSRSLNKSMGMPQATSFGPYVKDEALADADGGGDDTSMLTEISDLLDAYTKMRNAIRSFTRYVPRDVVRELLMANTLCRIAMDSKRCAMLFEDIANFTTICEKVPPPALSRAVRVYFERMSRLVALHGGIVDKFIGDCVMAVWGAPCDVSHPEVRAALCALAFHRATLSDPLARVFHQLDTTLAVRVGVAGGDVLAGNMGSPDRMSYTVIGDAVNLAARLESFNKQWGTSVMLSDDVAEEARNILVCRAVITASVVGRAAPVTVYDVAGVSPTAEAAAAQMQDGNDFSSFSAGMESANTDDVDLGTRMPVADVGQRLRFMKLVSYHARRNSATAADVGFATRFTEAVTALRGCQFAECAEALRSEVAQGLVPSSAVYDCRKSVQAVLQLAERLTESPPASDDLVDGAYVYRADHK